VRSTEQGARDIRQGVRAHPGFGLWPGLRYHTRVPPGVCGAYLAALGRNRPGTAARGGDDF
jgi:hypothetical protein